MYEDIEIEIAIILRQAEEKAIRAIQEKANETQLGEAFIEETANA